MRAGVQRLALLLGSIALAAAHFGFAQERNAPDLRVTGVMVSGPASLAIIAGPDGREKVVRLGHEIHPGATLAEVSAGGVIVDRDRRREWLPLVRGAAPQYQAPLGGPQGPMRPVEPVAAGAAPRGVDARSKVSAEAPRQSSSGSAPAVESK